VKRHFLKDKEIKNLELQVYGALHKKLSDLLGPKLRVESVTTPEAEIFLVDGKPLLMKTGGTVTPTLHFDRAVEILPKVIVDMGAVPHICNGADIMAPGIVGIEGKFDEGSFVVIVDERHRKPIAIGTANLSSTEMKGRKEGKVIRNMHFAGDSVWNLIKNLG